MLYHTVLSKYMHACMYVRNVGWLVGVGV